LEFYRTFHGAVAGVTAGDACIAVAAGAMGGAAFVVGEKECRTDMTREFRATPRNWSARLDTSIEPFIVNIENETGRRKCSGFFVHPYLQQLLSR
jgi:hypothetical protein